MYVIYIIETIIIIAKAAKKINMFENRNNVARGV